MIKFPVLILVSVNPLPQNPKRLFFFNAIPFNANPPARSTFSSRNPPLSTAVKRAAFNQSKMDETSMKRGKNRSTGKQN
ncbi:MAG: hypothetical protein GY737_15065 [Desulfobacteraceae bacterium]|nr:hypothetical protein [Desulfobacteraceae bacterium]